MDTDKHICHRFRDVFSFLSQSKCNIPDDAILHLFSDVVNSKLRDKRSIDESGVIQFLFDVTESVEDQNDDVINLSLDISGWLGSNEDYFSNYRSCLTQFIRTVWNKISLDNVSVTSALFNCLTRLTEHKKGLEWLINETEDIHRDCLKILETGASIFLQKAVINYITRLCTAQGDESHQSTVDKIIKSDILLAFRKYRTCLKEKRKIYPSSYVLSLLQLLEGLCSSKIICEVIIRTTVFEDLSSVIHLGEKVHADAAMTVIKVMYQNKKNLVEPTIEILTDELLLKGDLLKAQTVSLIRFKEENPKDFQMTEIFLLPIKCVLNLVVEEDGCEQKVSLSCLHQQMSTKQKLTTLLCKTIANMTLIKLLVPDLITKLLASTLSANNCCHEDFSKFLKCNSKVQRSCLEYLGRVHDIVQNRKTSLDIVSCIIPLISQTNVDSQMFSVCMKCLLPIFPTLMDTTNGLIEFPDKLALILQQQLCSVNWEQRDTTLELLSDLVMQYKENARLVCWVEENKLHHHVWQSKDDGESYVRATAIRCLYHISTCSRLWTSLLCLVDSSEEGFIGIIIAALESDTEAFVRRSAANFLHKYYMDRVNDKPNHVLEHIAKKMSDRIYDFDWEVKLHTLDFLKSVSNQELTICTATPDLSTLPEYAKTLLPNSESSRSTQIKRKNNLCRRLKKCHNLGCLQALLAALNDYDSKVSEEAVMVVSSLKQRLKSSCENLHVLEHEFLNSFLESCKNLTDEMCVNEPSSFGDKHKISDSDDNQKSCDDLTECVKRILNFNEEEHNASCQVESDYTKNPLSIIEDILSYGQKSEDDNVVDCY